MDNIYIVLICLLVLYCPDFQLIFGCTSDNIFPYTSNHQNIDCVVIAINLHVLSGNAFSKFIVPDLHFHYLLFRIYSLVIYCSKFALLFFVLPDIFFSCSQLIRDEFYYVETFSASYHLFSITRIRQRKAIESG